MFNKFNPSVLAVILIALSCFFSPDVKGQEKIDTSKTYNWSGQKVKINTPPPDTTAVDLIIAKEYPNYREINSKEPTFIKILTIADGYVVWDYWHAQEPKFLDGEKKPMKDRVYIHLAKKQGKK